MKTILVPTDFSKTADNALAMATGLAKEQHAGILLINAWEIAFPSTDIPFPGEYLAEQVKIAETLSMEGLAKSALKVKSAGGVQCDFISRQGDLTTVVTETAEREQADFIIMGTDGAKGFKGILTNSNTTKIIRKASCPVIAVPKNAVYNGFKKILYATNYQQSDFTILKKLTELARLFDAEITLLHITNEEYSHEGARMIMEAFTDKVKGKVHYDNISHKVLYAEENAEDMLREYVEHKHADLLVMSTHHRDWFDKLFGDSLTESVAYHSSMPLMVFHHEESGVLFV